MVCYLFIQLLFIEVENSSSEDEIGEDTLKQNDNNALDMLQAFNGKSFDSGENHDVEMDFAIGGDLNSAAGNLFLKELTDRAKQECAWWRPYAGDELPKTRDVASDALWGELLSKGDELDRAKAVRYGWAGSSNAGALQSWVPLPAPLAVPEDALQHGVIDSQTQKARRMQALRDFLEREQQIWRRLKNTPQALREDEETEELVTVAAQATRSISRLFNSVTGFRDEMKSSGQALRSLKFLPDSWDSQDARIASSSMSVDLTDLSLAIPYEEAHVFQELRNALLIEWDRVRVREIESDEKILEEFADVPLEKLTDEQKKKRQLIEKKKRMGMYLPGMSDASGNSGDNSLKRELDSQALERIPTLPKQLETVFNPLFSLNVSHDQFWLDRKVHVRTTDRTDRQGLAVRHASVSQYLIGTLKNATARNLSRINHPDIRCLFASMVSKKLPLRLIAHTPSDARLTLIDQANTTSMHRASSLSEDASFALIEYFEQHPPVLQLPAMGGRITRHYRPTATNAVSDSKDLETALEYKVGPFGDFRVSQDTPLPFLTSCAKLEPGQALSVFETGVTRSALFSHHPHLTASSQMLQQQTVSAVGRERGATPSAAPKIGSNKGILRTTDFLLVVRRDPAQNTVRTVLRPLISCRPPDATFHRETPGTVDSLQAGPPSKSSSRMRNPLVMSGAVSSRCKAAIFVSGQQEPLVEIPLPGSKEAEKLFRCRVKAWAQLRSNLVGSAVRSAELLHVFKFENMVSLFRGMTLCRPLGTFNRAAQFATSISLSNNNPQQQQQQQQQSGSKQGGSSGGDATGNKTLAEQYSPEVGCLYHSLLRGLWRLRQLNIRFVGQERYPPDRVSTAVHVLRQEIDADNKRRLELEQKRAEIYRKTFGTLPSSGDPAKNLLSKLFSVLRFGSAGDALLSACRFVEMEVGFSPWHWSSEYHAVAERRDGEFAIAFSHDTKYGKGELVNFLRSKQGRGRRKGFALGGGSVPGQKQKGVTGGAGGANENVDLRKLTMEELFDRLVKFGMKPSDVASMPRWDRVRMISVQAEHLRNKGLATEETEAYVRSNHQLKMVNTHAYYKEELAKVFQNLVTLLSHRGVPRDVENDEDDLNMGASSANKQLAITASNNPNNLKTENSKDPLNRLPGVGATGAAQNPADDSQVVMGFAPGSNPNIAGNLVNNVSYVTQSGSSNLNIVTTLAVSAAPQPFSSNANKPSDAELDDLAADLEKALHRDAVVRQRGIGHLTEDQREAKMLQMWREDQKRRREMAEGGDGGVGNVLEINKQQKIIARLKWSRQRKRGTVSGLHDESHVWVIGEQAIQAFERWRLGREKRKFIKRDTMRIAPFISSKGATYIHHGSSGVNRAFAASLQMNPSRSGGERRHTSRKNTEKQLMEYEMMGGDDGADNENVDIPSSLLMSRASNMIKSRRSKRSAEGAQVLAEMHQATDPLGASLSAAQLVMKTPNGQDALRRLNKFILAVFENIPTLSNGASRWFMTEVKERDAPQYYNRIPNPISIKDIKSLARAQKFTNRAEIIELVDLLVSNAETYNGIDHQVSLDAHVVRDHIMKILLGSERDSELKALEMCAMQMEPARVNALRTEGKMIRKEQIESARHAAHMHEKQIKQMQQQQQQHQIMQQQLAATRRSAQGGGSKGKKKRKTNDDDDDDEDMEDDYMSDHGY